MAKVILEIKYIVEFQIFSRVLCPFFSYLKIVPNKNKTLI